MGRVRQLFPSGSRFNGRYGVAIDSANHVWVTNSKGDSVTALNGNGTLFGNFAPAGSNFSARYNLAIDGSDHVWVTNTYVSSVTALNKDEHCWAILPLPARTLIVPWRGD